MKTFLKVLVTVLFFSSLTVLNAEDGYRLWLRYDLIDNPAVLTQYRKAITGYMAAGNSQTIEAAKNELQMSLSGLLGSQIPVVSTVKKGTVIAGTPENSPIISSLKLNDKLRRLGNEGYLITNSKYKGKKIIVITANTDIGVLYGTFHFLRLLQMNQGITDLSISSSPGTKVRILNHWDMLPIPGRKSAGNTIWKWDELPGRLDSRYTDYARANASIGINATVLTNVNADARLLTPEYMEKVAALADVFRPYGIKMYLAAKVTAPIEIGKLQTADPLDKDVIAWWKKAADDLYNYIPDFGGFVVKANSEGQPGPLDYNRTHADGANLLADAVGPHGGIIMWRAFVYDNKVPDDRIKQPYNEFIPFNGKFRKNVILQVKNGPLDFQPREPFHPLFGAMPDTPLMPEFQIMQEYFGFTTHLVFLAPVYEECLKSDTYSKGEGSLVARIVDGTISDYSLTGMAGVSNIGADRNWTGHIFGQSNWYAFGRLAWDPYISSAEIADEWVRMTFSNKEEILKPISRFMVESREIAVNYMTPLGLHHIMAAATHYGPGPWVDKDPRDPREDWTSLYYHRADENGIGFNRTSTGSNAVSQYYPPVRDMFNNIETCPENLLLWFHHVSWDYKMRSGRTLWDELCYRYNDGVNKIREVQQVWDNLKPVLDAERYENVRERLIKQVRDARIWKDGCIVYFQTFSRRPLPPGVEAPEHDLEWYKTHRYTDIPGMF
ncbi:MAG: alpha-glucuronidase [Bacteroidales bacterium]|nr:alpha-glucuronidase [Bacteroidales bacterium]